MKEVDFIFNIDNIKNAEHEVIKILTHQHKIGYDVDFLLSCIDKIYSYSNKFQIDFNVFDLCGTGGSGKNRINLSTALSFLMKDEFAIAKHGNRSSSGKIGSFDIIEKIGYKISENEIDTIKFLKKDNIAFLLAPNFNIFLGNFKQIRAKIQHPTLFNYLMPLLHPISNLTAQIIGVSDIKIIPKLAEIARILKKNCLFVHDLKNGLDDCSICGKTKATSVIFGNIREYEFYPEDYNIKTVLDEKSIMTNGRIDENIKIFNQIITNSARVEVERFVKLNYLVAKEFFNKFI